MIEHVYRRASAARAVGAVIVATDDSRIFDAVEAFGGVARMTRRDHTSGTDRIAEVARTLDVSVVVNLQCDEPLIEPEMIDLVTAPLFESDDVAMSTLATPLRDERDLWDPNVVKVVVSRGRRALYFSRAAIPFWRDSWMTVVEDDGRGIRLRSSADHHGYSKHIGIYAFRRSFLLDYAQLEPTPLERLERLEQLRALENDHPIHVVLTQHDSLGVDTEDDLNRIRAMVEARQGDSDA